MIINVDSRTRTCTISSMNKLPKTLSWKPVLKGTIYCAPGCGGQCTKAAYDKAVKDANATMLRMKGNGWKVVVFENLGWHWHVVSGPVQVHPERKGKGFWCMIGSEPKDNAGGSGLWTSSQVKVFKDPNRAVADALNDVYPVIERLNKTLRAAEIAAGLQK